MTASLPDDAWTLSSGWPVEVDPTTGMPRAVAPPGTSAEESINAMLELSREYWRRKGLDFDAPVRRDVLRIVRRGRSSSTE